MAFFTEARTCGKKEAPGNLQDPRQGSRLVDDAASDEWMPLLSASPRQVSLQIP